MKEWTLDVLVKRLDWATKITAKQLCGISEEDYRELLLATADRFFDNGRYSTKTEWSIEMYELQQPNDALNDLGQINHLTNAQRVRLGFYKDFIAICFPLFKRQPLNLSASPFNFADPTFSIKNHELVRFLFDSGYQYLGYVICEALVRTYWDDKELLDTVVMNELSQNSLFHFYRDEKEFKEQYEKLVGDIIDAQNHLEIGKRLGLSPTAQAIYDMTDTFICREYDYRQVDFSKALAKWIEENWDMSDINPSGEKEKALMDELNRLAVEYHISFCSKGYTINYIFLDLLGCSLFSPEEQTDDDFDDFDDWGLPDE